MTESAQRRCAANRATIPLPLKRCPVRQNNRPTYPQWEMIEFSDAIVLEEKGNDVSVNGKTAHPAGSAFPCPRHSWSAARKSSIDSS